MTPSTKRVKPTSCCPSGVARSGSGRGDWPWLFAGVGRVPDAALGVCGGAVRMVAVGLVLAAIVGVAALSVDPGTILLCCVVAGAAVLPVDAVGVPPPCGSEITILDSRKIRPITAAMPLTARSERRI
jgi:hypothetical protein